jgi:AraC-like DNA-binding protein
MSYREHASSPALSTWLECVWQREAGNGPPVRVVPDGCIDIVWTENAGTQIVGANTTAFVVERAPGTRVAGARLHPGAAPSLLGIDGIALRDGRAPLEAVWGDDGRMLAEQLDEAPDRVAVLLAALAVRAASAEAPDPLVSAAVARLHAPAVHVGPLARELAVSERQLRRRVEAAVGYGPKRLARVLRLRRALDAARTGTELAQVAAEAGYADQAHFTHECRDLAGVPPSAALAA